MIDDAAFEVVGDELGWHWQLREGETYLAYPATVFDSPADARSGVERARAAAAARSDSRFDATDPVDDADVVVHSHRTTGACSWQLDADGEPVAVSALSFDSAADARSAADRFRRLALGAIPVFFEGDGARDPLVVGQSSFRGVAGVLLRGVRHRRRLRHIDTRVVVTGTRGKSSATRHLGDAFLRRGHDTLVKLTGDRPHLVHNGDYIPIDRQGSRVTLYENVRAIEEYLSALTDYTPTDVAVFENQALSEYTMRLFNRRLVRPQAVLLTNVRQDHRETLGDRRADIARSFGRSIPPDTHVVCAEQHAALVDLLRREVERAGASFQRVTVPDRYAEAIGAPTVYGVSELLAALGYEPLPDDEIESYLDAIRPRWSRLPSGVRLYNAATVNDIESTERMREKLAGDEPITPLVSLRPDRRARTAAFVRYLDTLDDAGLVGTAHVVGANARTFARETSVAVERHDDHAPDDVLDALVADGLPVIVMGNAVTEFMRAFNAEVAYRTGSHEAALAAR